MLAPGEGKSPRNGLGRRRSTADTGDDAATISADTPPMGPQRQPSGVTSIASRPSGGMERISTTCSHAIRKGLPQQESKLRDAEQELERCEASVRRAQQEAADARLAMQQLQWEVEEAKNALGQETAEYLRSLLNAHGKFGIDIGGTAAKIVYLQSTTGRDSFCDNPIFEKDHWGCTGQRHRELEFTCPHLGGRVHFVHFATHRVNPVLQQLRDERLRSDTDLPQPNRCVYATGGGAFKFEKLSRSAVGITYAKVGEFESLVEGFRFIMQEWPESVYSIDTSAPAPSGVGVHIPARVEPDDCFLICNIGSGVSIIKVDGDSAVRLGGTSIGGSSFLGLSRLCTGADTFPEAVRLAEEGDPNKVDLTVRDIYGERGEAHLGLPGHIVACSFGKLVGMDKPQGVDKGAVAASLMKMITQAISLYASTLAELHGCQAIFFTGGFLRDNPISELRFAEACEVKRCPALFLKHADYLGALGCLSRRLAHGDSPTVVPLTPHPVTPKDQDSKEQPPAISLPAAAVPVRGGSGRTSFVTSPTIGAQLPGIARELSRTASRLCGSGLAQGERSKTGESTSPGMVRVETTPRPSPPRAATTAAEVSPPSPMPMIRTVSGRHRLISNALGRRASQLPAPSSGGAQRACSRPSPFLFGLGVPALLLLSGGYEGLSVGAVAALVAAVPFLAAVVLCAAEGRAAVSEALGQGWLAVPAALLALAPLALPQAAVLTCWLCMLLGLHTGVAESVQLVRASREHHAAMGSAAALMVRALHSDLCAAAAARDAQATPADAAVAWAALVAAAAAQAGLLPPAAPRGAGAHAAAAVAACVYVLWVPLQVRAHSKAARRALVQRTDLNVAPLIALLEHDPVCGLRAPAVFALCSIALLIAAAPLAALAHYAAGNGSVCLDQPV
eukprot:TRINITY_DN5876_c1_g1_i1.p1 TRINITY_DN5876_c1_g1~~TRINITY_DN5876_c1_g1_i1.p1  ORF type:complete len:925 (+),score=280.65 TRINITY_DN5876_c1_g1_i1:67-2775(+)